MKKTLLFLFAAAATMGLQAKDVTLDFTGTGNIGDLTRQTVPSVSSSTVTFSTDLDFTVNNVNINCHATDDVANYKGGFALVHCTGTSGANPSYNGLTWLGGYGATTQTHPEITFSVPNGKIDKIVVYVAGSTLSTTSTTASYSFNGTTLECTKVDNIGTAAQLVTFTYTPSEPAASIMMAAAEDNLFYSRTIQKVELSYTSEGSSQVANDLLFKERTCEGVAGQAFTAPELTNPHNLPVSWSSSDENVATVDENGAVTLIAKGSANIIATFAGSMQYEDGAVFYTVKVWGSAKNITELNTLAPALNDKVYIDFPLTVTYPKGATNYVMDNEGNATRIYNTKNDGETSAQGNIYKVGDVIPAGWLATNSNIMEAEWKGLPESTNLESVDVVYPIVESVNYKEDAFKVVVMKDVTFTSETPDGNIIVEGTFNGNTYKFDNRFGIGIQPAGTYTVTGVVFYNTKASSGSCIAPIEFKSDALELPTAFEVSLNVEGLTIAQTNSEEEGYTIAISGKTSENTITVTLGVPEGFDGFIGMNMADYMGGDHQMFKVAIDDEYWITKEEMLEAGLKEGNSMTFTTGEEGSGQFYLYKGDQVYNLPISVEVDVAKDNNVAVEGIEIEEGNARYFNLQGVEIAKPVNGIYVKVANGKAIKIVK